MTDSTVTKKREPQCRWLASLVVLDLKKLINNLQRSTGVF